MSAADKVANVNTLHRTHIMTSSATRTLLVIDGSEIIYYLDCSLGTGLLALAAGYTAVLANLAHLSALIVTRALNDYSGSIVDEVNNVVGTSLCAKAAAYALSGINLGYSLLGIDAYCISRADLHTVAVAEAGKGTVTVTRIGHIRRYAGFDTVVNVLSL